ncbi:hypothetical protein ACQP2F_30235 [Actinoplanes sp. CA-030573]|uniref:hypothetical protein n=1 Tax=Actinoplanes sp. CA-030573 TaxID=3239898 RepID=UPI003D9214A8
MSLTGLRLIALAAAALVGVAAATVWLWPRGARLRPVTRTLTVLLVEALTVLTVGLVVNRHEQFYPSWQALRGDTGTVATTAVVHAGVLDHHVPPGPFAWRPHDLAAWHLAAPPTVTLPADYAIRATVTFPVVLALGVPPPALGDAVLVRLAPTPRTTAGALLGLPSALRHDLRVTATGWDVVGGGPLGAAFVAAAPAGLATRDRTPDEVPPALAAPLKLPS